MTLKIAMIATGGIADSQLAPALALAPHAQLWSVYSRDKARADAFAARHGAASPDAAHDDLDALLADPELDAVLIASPDKLHADQAVRAAKAGKHVLTEKPMATDRESAAAMVEAAEKADVVLAVAYHMRWHMGHRKLFEAAQEGAFGTPRHMRIQWPSLAQNADGWRASTAELCASVLFKGPRIMEFYGSDGYAICTETLGPHGKGRIETQEGSFDYVASA